MAESKSQTETPLAMLERLLKRCTQCGEWKARTGFHRNSRSKDGLTTACKVCKNWASHLQLLRDREKLCQQKREWHKRNALRLKPIKEKWCLLNTETICPRKTAQYECECPQDTQKYLAPVHKQRARKLHNDGSYTPEEWAALCEHYGSRCLWCDCSGPLTVGHVVPLSRGGSNDIANLQPLCRHCNFTKHDRIMDFRLFHEIE